MKTDLFDFELPQEAIALRPAEPRDSARLLVVRPEAEHELEDRTMRDLPSLLRKGDVLVVNDTKVIPARLFGTRERNGVTVEVEATLIKRLGPERWQALARPAKRLEPGDRVRFGHESRVCLLGALDATVEEKGGGGEITLRFDFHGAILDEAIDALGHIPLPPYIASKREDDERDRGDYQTMFAAHEGSVAAPTAGLHFTDLLTANLRDAGVGIERVTLHVGPGTFLPVKTDDVGAHKMHAEYGQINDATADAINKAKAEGGRVIAVGTTALRLLESAADLNGKIKPFASETDIFITPGYRFRAVDALLTNFHLPRSTLFMLVSAFSGLERMKRAYVYAIASGYRFYSYGDGSLLFPESPR
ncbi:MAG: tRNA preQ1(34) S-adenosylmethionine ribosyltransferase-isomerase QueA [Xanthobacteraceae bacterium]|nr:tRNA preQ1(34) S-adenosylmethionine ribosyltransferase-isomerase QueA [Xanthobacteraceae bacterium]MCW5674801.1 tRNA preQ1(34) S-adenosylmethionine ribosyltransferase-isomerase QueA [Xanthobacteraceae bacterium]